MTAHELVITSDRRVALGRQIKFRCRNCENHGDFTISPVSSAIGLFRILAEAHRRTEAES